MNLLDSNLASAEYLRRVGHHVPTNEEFYPHDDYEGNPTDPESVYLTLARLRDALDTRDECAGIIVEEAVFILKAGGFLP